MKIWRLKSKEERRFKQGHPWVYSNELQESPKGIAAGEWVELCDASGNFLAYGFGNPSSLIAFRALTREKIIPSVELFEQKFLRALQFRLDWYSAKTSFRAVFGEADELPGLVIDRYFSKEKTVYVVQPHAAGMDLHLEMITQALKLATKKVFPEEQAMVILRRDAGSREKEGLTKLPTEFISLDTLQPMTEVTFLSDFTFLVSGIKRETVQFSADLIKGQKTGFFFDQLDNTRLVGNLVSRSRKLKKQTKNAVKVLDLCTYVGQWSVQLADVLTEISSSISLTVVDASESALEFAEKNIRTNFTAALESKTLSVTRMKADVLDPMPALPENEFDVVIADPPALIKSRKVIPQGKQAYVQLMREAIRRVKPGGMVIACSCSQLLSHEDFIEVLSKSARASKKTVRWVAQGTSAIDHFQRFEFREGHYLKCWVGTVN